MSLTVALHHSFPGFTLDARFEAPAGITVLFGRSGSGKTSIINAISGLLRPDEGEITLDGVALTSTRARHHLPPHARRLGYVFQEGRLFPHLSVQQNLAYGGWVQRRRADAAQFDQVVEMLGLGPLLTRRPAALSGGEKQRVAIGRALLARPQLVLADEPLASLDEPRKAEILPYFERLRDEVSIPIVYVSHAAAEVARLATTVVALEKGRVIRQGPAIEVLGDPMIAPTGIRAVGALLEAKVAAHHEDGLTELAAGPEPLFLPRINQPVGKTLRIRIAAQEVILARAHPQDLSALNILSGTVEAVRTGEGPGAIVSVKTAAGAVLARVTQRSVARLGLAPGTECFAVLKSVAVAPEDVGQGV